MAIIAHVERYSITAAAGAISQTIRTGDNILYDIQVEAATSGTTFDVNLVDRYDNTIFEREDITGRLSEILQKLAHGNWTLSIANASKDEVFKVLLLFREN